MVLLHYKKTEHNQFLFETTVNSPIEQVIHDLVEINNLRIVLDRLSVAVEDLASHGIMKPDELRGLSGDDTIKHAIEMMPKEKLQWSQKPQMQPGWRFNEDPHHYRFGVIQTEDVTKMMIQTAQEAKNAINKNQVNLKINLSAKLLNEHLNNLRGAVMIAYPAYHGLPPWEPAKLLLENQHELEGQETDIGEYLDEKDAALWWAGKEMLKGKLLKDYVGKNEKTKIICKITKVGAGMPAREAAVDEDTYKKMISFYHKKQEEQKKLEDDNDDHYLDAPWANSGQLKQQLHGASDGIAFKPLGKKL